MICRVNKVNMSFLRSVSQLARGRDAALKRELLNNLSECVKDIQYHSQFQDSFTSVVGPGDASSELCGALEALLLHGLKDTLLRKARNALSDTERRRRPQPDFWPLVLVVSHRQSVEHIAALPHITTPIGQCRAWLRAALNDCLLSSYLDTLLRNCGSVKPFYTRSAFACDAELLELAHRLVEGLESCVQFNIPLNSSLLNDWPESVLVAAGLWEPPAREAPISAGLDVARTLRDEPAPTALSEDRQPDFGLGRRLALDEDEALKFILSERSNESHEAPSHARPPPVSQPSLSPLELEPGQSDDIVSPDREPSPEHVSLLCECSNEIGGRSSWSEVSTELPGITNLADDGDGDTDSLSSLAGAEDTPDLRDMMRDIHAELISGPVETVTPSELPTRQEARMVPNDDHVLRQLGFELVPAEESSFTPDEWLGLVAQLGSLSRELGLDSQNYQCAGCQDLLGGGASRARACAFTGKYFCDACMDPEVFVIPARVVHNWDFRRYAVSRSAARFLLEVQHRPLLDVRTLNPRAYAGVAELRALRDLRVQLNLLRAYAATCRERERLGRELRRMLWPREYLYEAVHTYAPGDLVGVPTGALAAALGRVVGVLRDHVRGCWLCSQKGFICEVCRAPDALYPFDMDAVYRCERCCGVFHAECQRAALPCPKCRRRAKRSGEASRNVAPVSP